MAKTRASFNKIHPETGKGEVFLTNISDDNDYGMSRMLGNRYGHSDWESIGWKTKRKGSTAYDIYGKLISGMRPVFVQRAELKREGIDPEKL